MACNLPCFIACDPVTLPPTLSLTLTVLVLLCSLALSSENGVRRYHGAAALRAGAHVQARVPKGNTTQTCFFASDASCACCLCAFPLSHAVSLLFPGFDGRSFVCLLL